MGKQIAINVDCIEYMRTLPDKAFDLAIVAPRISPARNAEGITAAR